MSHNAKSHNVVLKVTVPRRTGRKRKRGSEGPWQGDVDVVDSGEPPSSQGKVSSQARMDDPKLLKRKLQDNVGSYDVEIAGIIEHSHRFRGLADFYWDMSSRSDFARRYIDQVLPGDGKYSLLLREAESR
jgi:general transcription factor 3C polypeptide 5 (transcription factor C subunit 1)